MFGHVNPTPFDLRFSLFGIPVYVHPLFWIVAGAITWIPQRLDLVVIGILCVFVSILVHELGHALFQRRWGTGNYIQLHYCGGVAVFFPDAGYTPKRAIIVSLAGPGAGFLLAGLVYAFDYSLSYLPRNITEIVLNEKTFLHYGFAISTLLYINIWWGILNLMPILPLDGGHVSMNLCQIFLRYRAQEWAYKIGMLTALILIVWINRHGTGDNMFITIFFAYFGFQNWQAYNQLTGRNF